MSLSVDAVLGAQVGVTLPTPEGIPVEAVTPDVCLSMLAAVPADLDTKEIHAAKATVQSTAAELQVSLHMSVGGAYYVVCNRRSAYDRQCSTNAQQEELLANGVTMHGDAEPT